MAKVDETRIAMRRRPGDVEIRAMTLGMTARNTKRRRAVAAVVNAMAEEGAVVAIKAGNIAEGVDMEEEIMGLLGVDASVMMTPMMTSAVGDLLLASDEVMGVVDLRSLAKNTRTLVKRNTKHDVSEMNTVEIEAPLANSSVVLPAMILGHQPRIPPLAARQFATTTTRHGRLDASRSF